MARSPTHRFKKLEDDATRIFEPDRVLESLWRIDWKKEGLPYCGVYVISTDSLTPCKIGMSISAPKRLATLQTAHWRELQVSDYRWCESVSDAKKVEQEAHSILRENGKELLGEWFNVRPSQAVEAMDWAALSLGITLNNHIPDVNDIKARIQRFVDTVWHNHQIIEHDGFSA